MGYGHTVLTRFVGNGGGNASVVLGVDDDAAELEFFDFFGVFVAVAGFDPAGVVGAFVDFEDVGAEL